MRSWIMQQGVSPADSHIFNPLGFAQTVCRVTRGSHRQSFRNPSPSHRRFRPQSPGNLDLLRIGFPSLLQLRRAPAAPSHFLLQNPLRLGFGRFDPFAPTVMAAELLAHLFQQFPPKFCPAQAPPPPQRLPLHRLLLPPPRFHHPLELLAPSRAVLWKAHLAEYPVHPRA